MGTGYIMCVLSPVPNAEEEPCEAST